MSGRKFSMVSPAIWRPGRFLSLSSSDAQVLHLYCLTSEHQTSCGAFRAPDGYVMADLGWDKERYHTARQELVGADLIAFDSEQSTIYVKRWLRHCGAQTDKQATGIRRVIERIESDMIRELVEEDFLAAEDLRKPSEPVNDNPLDSPIGYGSRLTQTPFLRGGGRQ